MSPILCRRGDWESNFVFTWTTLFYIWPNMDHTMLTHVPLVGHVLYQILVLSVVGGRNGSFVVNGAAAAGLSGRYIQHRVQRAIIHRREGGGVASQINPPFKNWEHFCCQHCIGAFIVTHLPHAGCLSPWYGEINGRIIQRIGERWKRGIYKL